MTGDEKWLHYDNPKRRKSWGMPGHAFASTARPNIHGASIDVFEPSIEGETATVPRETRQVILQHDNARPHVARPVKTYLETLKWKILPHSSYSPDVAPSDYHFFRSMSHDLAHQHFRSYEEVKKWTFFLLII